MGDVIRKCVDCEAAIAAERSPKVVRCDPCRLARKRALNREAVRRCHAAHRPERMAYQAAWRAKNPGYSSAWRKARSADRGWVDAQRAKRSQTRRRLLERDPDYWARWARENPSVGRRSRQARRARKMSVASEPYTVADLAARDGWKCGLCGKKVPKSAKWPDRRAATVDHIVPLSEGGSDMLANVQLAHFGCNCSKSNRSRPEGEQLRLIG